MIYTSCFGSIDEIRKHVPDARFVSIAGAAPELFIGEKYKPLMPHYSLWKEWHDKFLGSLGSAESVAWYADKYNIDVLSKLDPLTTARELKNLVDWHPTFLLCYEPIGKFCHRHIVAGWLAKHHIECMEWSYEDKS